MRIKKFKKPVILLTLIVVLASFTITMFAASSSFTFDFDSVLYGQWRELDGNGRNGYIEIETDVNKVYYHKQGTNTSTPSKATGNFTMEIYYKAHWWENGNFIETCSMQYPGSTSYSFKGEGEGYYKIIFKKVKSTYDTYVCGTGYIGDSK